MFSTRSTWYFPTGFALLLFGLVAWAAAQTPGQSTLLQSMREEAARTGFEKLLKNAGVTLNYEKATSTLTLVSVPVKEHWSEMLQKTDQAIIGAFYTKEGFKNTDLPPGLFAVQARRVEGIVHWRFLRPDGSNATKPIQVCVEKLSEDTGFPRALILFASPRRCCWEDDKIRHCGECD